MRPSSSRSHAFAVDFKHRRITVGLDQAHTVHTTPTHTQDALLPIDNNHRPVIEQANDTYVRRGHGNNGQQPETTGQQTT